jgi:glycosyltransferase involved in cell wall biosynthesis
MLVGTTPKPASTTYTSLLYEAVEARGVTIEEITVGALLRRRYDIVHFHWPDWYLSPRPGPSMVFHASAMLVALAWARKRGARVVWTAHNLVPHERRSPRMSRWFYWAFTGLVDAVIVPTASGVDPMRRRFPRLAAAPTAVVPLGHLAGRYPDHGSRAVARAHLGLAPEGPVITYFGHIRPYKNVPGLVDRFRLLPDHDITLVVAGRPLNDDVRAAVEAAAAGDPRVRLHLAYIDDEEVQHYMRGADLVVLPYAESSNSFVALLALSFDRPILAPDIGAFPELAAAVGTRWVRLYRDDLSGHALAVAVDAARRCPIDGARPDLTAFDWTSVGEQTVSAYERFIRAPRTRRRRRQA